MLFLFQKFFGKDQSAACFQKFFGLVGDFYFSTEIIIFFQKINNLLSEMMNVNNKIIFLSKRVMLFTLARAFGCLSVKGFNLVPFPAANIKAFILYAFS